MKQISNILGNILVDDELYDKLIVYKWKVYNFKELKNYAMGNVDGRNVYMHRYIMENVLGRSLESHEEIDHINGNSIDNRLENLRICNHSENTRNKLQFKHSKSKYIGVYKYPESHETQYKKPYLPSVTLNGKKIELQRCDTAEEAARIRDIAAIKYHGSYANLNFEENRAIYIQMLSEGFMPELEHVNKVHEYKGIEHVETLYKPVWSCRIYLPKQEINVGRFSSEKEALTAADTYKLYTYGQNLKIHCEGMRYIYEHQMLKGHTPCIIKKGKGKQSEFNFY